MKRIRLVALLGIVGLGGLWVAHGQHTATLTEKLVKTKVVDDMGDEEIVEKWVPTLEIGLDYIGPAAAFLVLLVGFTTWRLRVPTAD